MGDVDSDDGLYDDLELPQSCVSCIELSKEVECLKSERERLLLETKELKEKVDEQMQKVDVLVRNISCIFKTAKAELTRKDKLMEALIQDNRSLEGQLRAAGVSPAPDKVSRPGRPRPSRSSLDATEGRIQASGSRVRLRRQMNGLKKVLNHVGRKAREQRVPGKEEETKGSKYVENGGRGLDPGEDVEGRDGVHGDDVRAEKAGALSRPRARHEDGGHAGEGVDRARERGQGRRALRVKDRCTGLERRRGDLREPGNGWRRRDIDGGVRRLREDARHGRALKKKEGSRNEGRSGSWESRGEDLGDREKGSRGKNRDSAASELERGEERDRRGRGHDLLLEPQYFVEKERDRTRDEGRCGSWESRGEDPGDREKGLRGRKRGSEPELERGEERDRRRRGHDVILEPQHSAEEREGTNREICREQKVHKGHEHLQSQEIRHHLSEREEEGRRKRHVGSFKSPERSRLKEDREAKAKKRMLSPVNGREEERDRRRRHES